MKKLPNSAMLFLLTSGLTIGGVASISAAPAGWFQDYPRGAPAPYSRMAYPAPYTGLRDVVDRTQSDLRASADLEHGNDKQRDRYRDAQGHLSSFDRHLTKGHFDKGELDKSIDKIKDILDHNVLQASSRDALLRDLDDLKAARDRRW